MDDVADAFRAGDEAAVREVYRRYGGAVTTVARAIVRQPELVEEVVQTTFLKAWRILEPEEVADTVVEGLADERFLILPHPEVADYERARATDRDRWLGAMRRLQAKLLGR